MNGIDDQIQSYYEKQAKKAAAKARQNNPSIGSNGGSNHNGSSNNSGGSSNDGGSYTPVTPSGSGYTWPVPGHTALSSVFGEDRGTYGHGAIDIYGHLTRAVVSQGSHVSKGQVIGYVGSTGWSSGPHLHFECRINGTKYDPMSEF